VKYATLYLYWCEGTVQGICLDCQEGCTMTKADGKDVFHSDVVPECLGQVHGCLVNHCDGAKICREISEKQEENE